MGKENTKDDRKALQDCYSMMTNAGLVVDDESPTGFLMIEDNSAEYARYTIKDMITTTDLTRFIPTVVQMIVREAIEPNLLIVPNLFTSLNIPNGRTVQIGAVGAMTAAPIPEGGEYPTRDLDLDGGSAVSVAVSKHGLQVSITDETIEDNSFDIIGMWLRAAGKAF